MKPLLIASLNSGKILEFKKLLQPTFECLIADKRAPEVIEDGKTYIENAEKKARAFYGIYRVPVLSDDSGLEIDALNGKPGIYSARFGGETLTWPQRWAYLYQLLSGVPEEKWTARFRAVLCYYDGKASARFFEAVTEGRLLTKPQGANGFGYDPIFFSIPLNKSFGQASQEEKAQVSHRANAAKLFLQQTP